MGPPSPGNLAFATTYQKHFNRSKLSTLAYSTSNPSITTIFSWQQSTIPIAYYITNMYFCCSTTRGWRVFSDYSTYTAFTCHYRLTISYRIAWQRDSKMLYLATPLRNKSQSTLRHWLAASKYKVQLFKVLSSRTVMLLPIRTPLVGHESYIGNNCVQNK